MRLHHENDLNLSTQNGSVASAERLKRSRRKGAFTAGGAVVLTAALVAGGLSTDTDTSDDAAQASGNTDRVALAAGAGPMATAALQTRQASAVKNASVKSASVKSASAKSVKQKKVKLKKSAKAKRQARLKRLAKRYPRKAGSKMMKARGFSKRNRVCVIKLWNKESNWRWWADNPHSSAYGIPQALPGRKMASAGRDWRTNPVTQIKWGLRYIKQRYGTGCAAWRHSQAHNWY